MEYGKKPSAGGATAGSHCKFKMKKGMPMKSKVMKSGKGTKPPAGMMPKPC